MPVPNDIQNNPLAYAQVWTGNRNVTGRGTPQAPGVVKARRFVTYIEVLEQGAHDPEIRTLAIQRGMTPRPMHRGRVSPLNTTATQLTYYAPHGQEAADIVSQFMTATWMMNPNPNNTVFAPNTPRVVGGQAIIRNNGYSYEITMWYDVGNVPLEPPVSVYVAFHCYYRL